MTTNSFDSLHIGSYQILGKLGQGGMGTVYQARQTALNRDVALKVLPRDLAQEPGYLERFNIEAEISASLEHPHIVPILDYGTQQGISYVAMRYLRGGTLHQRLRQRAEKGQDLPSLKEVADLLQKLASALDYAHSQNVIHRDIKPNNIMFDEHGTPYVVDFGIAKLLENTAHLTSTGMTLGTPAYMPPEQWMSGEVTPATDQYALGVLMYELLAGQPPYTADNPFALMHKHVYTKPVPLHEHNPDLAPEISAVVEKALAKEAPDRYASVMEFANAFSTAIANLDTQQLSGFFTYQLRTPSAQRMAADTFMPDERTFLTPQEPQAIAKNYPKKPKGIFKLLPVAVIVLAIIGVISLAGGLVDGGESSDTQNNENSNIADTTPISVTESATPVELAQAEITPSSVPVGGTPIPATVAASLPDGATDTLRFTGFDYEQPLFSDDFEDEEFNDSLNRSLWTPYEWSDGQCSAWQTEGILAVAGEADNDTYNCTLSFGNPAALGSVGAFSADIKLPDPTGLQTTEGISITDQPNDRGVYCGLNTDYGDGRAYFHFILFEDGTHTVDNYYEAEFDRWYNIRLEVDPMTMQFTCVVDGQILDQGIPEFKDPFRNGNQFYFLLQNHLGEAETTLAHVDNVRLLPLTLYDGFNVDAIKWDLWEDIVSDEECTHEIIGGSLMFYNNSEADPRKCLMLATEAPDIELGDLEYFAAQVFLTDDASGYNANQGLLLITDDEERSWWAYCGLDTRTEAGLTIRIHTSDGVNVTIPAEFEEWYDVRFTVDPDTLMVSCFANDELVGKFQPDNLELLERLGIDFGIENLRTSDEEARGLVDNVRIAEYK